MPRIQNPLKDLSVVMEMLHIVLIDFRAVRDIKD